MKPTRFLPVLVLFFATAFGVFAASTEGDRLLDEVMQRGCAFFVFEAHPDSGLVKDRAGNTLADDSRIASVASTGFGLAVLPVMVEHGWQSRENAQRQAEKTLRFVHDRLTHEHGWLFHFVDWKTGQRAWNCEVSSIDTGLFLAGALVAGEYFGGTVKELAQSLYDRVDFVWMLTDGGTRPNELLLCHGWKPESGFLKSRWDSASEHGILNILALGSKTTPIPPTAWDAWLRNFGEYNGHRTFAIGPLYVHQYSQAFVDFRDRRDRKGINYWETAVAATRGNRDFCIENASRFKGYGPDSWGLSATDGPDGYKAYGSLPGRPAQDGTIAPWATVAATAFIPEATRAVTHFRKAQPALWGRYGFSSGFNVDRNWYSTDVIGIDVGAAVLLLENTRSGLVWKLFMQIPEVQAALGKAGFEKAK